MNTSSSSSNKNKRTEADRQDNASPPPPKKTKSTTTTSDTPTGSTNGTGSSSSSSCSSISNANDQEKAATNLQETTDFQDEGTSGGPAVSTDPGKQTKSDTSSSTYIISTQGYGGGGKNAKILQLIQQRENAKMQLVQQQENAKMMKEQQISLIKKIPRVEVDQILLDFHNKEMDKGMSKLETSYNNQEIRDGVLENEDFMMNILSYVGPGNYIYVALVCKNFKQYYLDYFKTLQDDEIPMAFLEGNTWPYARAEDKRKATVTDTFYSAAFTSLSHAKFWDQDTNGNRNRLSDRRVCQTVSKYGHPDVLGWARRQKGFPWNKETCINAARCGNLKGLKYCHENGCEWDHMTCASAASGGHLDVLKWARENGCDWDEWTCEHAAGSGHLAVLQWARQQDPPCPWNPRTCGIAACFGHLAVLQWARNNGCPWNSYTFHRQSRVDNWWSYNGLLTMVVPGIRRMCLKRFSMDARRL